LEKDVFVTTFRNSNPSIMNANAQIISKFYSAFDKKDHLTMNSCYHPEATFYDPVFETLNCNEVKGMWEMLTTTAKDLRIQCSNIQADGDQGTCRWDAWYTFTATGRKVHNIIYASFKFRDGKIIDHRDRFDFWRWTRMALGMSGILLGWSPIVRNKVRRTAQGRLRKFMSK
jgi:limonene-1,2-epoxide hydrolase